MKEFNTILCWIDLKTIDSTDNSTIENTTICIANIVENFPVNCMNVQERYLKDNLIPQKSVPSLRFRWLLPFWDIYQTDRIRLTTKDKTSSALFLPQFVLVRLFSGQRCSQRYAFESDFFAPGICFLYSKMDHGLTGVYS
jgi:hypothetical protein